MEVAVQCVLYTVGGCCAAAAVAPIPAATAWHEEIAWF